MQATKNRKNAKPISQVTNDKEKKELDAVGAEAAIYLRSLNKRGYALLPAGNFLGSALNIGYQVVKIKKPKK